MHSAKSNKTKMTRRQSPLFNKTKRTRAAVTHMLGTESKMWQTEAMAVSLHLTNLSHWLSRGISSFRNRERKWKKYQKRKKKTNRTTHTNVFFTLYEILQFWFRTLILNNCISALNKDWEYIEIHWRFWADLFKKSSVICCLVLT